MSDTQKPFQIFEIQPDNCDGVIGLHPCPGKRKGTDNFTRYMDEDIQAIMYWGAEATVTLMEPGELTAKGVEQLGERLVHCGMQWFHLPIPDDDLPDEQFHKRWPIVLERLNFLLDKGKKFTLHCQGGTGRTGFVAAMILLSRGIDKQRVEQLVKAARPGALTMPVRRAFLGLDKG